MYHLIEITNYVDGTKESKGIYSYDSRTDAIANFHSKMGGAMKHANYKSEMLMVIDERGGLQIYDYWEREPEEAEIQE